MIFLGKIYFDFGTQSLQQTHHPNMAIGYVVITLF